MLHQYRTGKNLYKENAVVMNSQVKGKTKISKDMDNAVDQPRKRVKENRNRQVTTMLV